MNTTLEEDMKQRDEDINNSERYSKVQDMLSGLIIGIRGR